MHLQLVISPAHFVDRYGRRVLTNAGQPGMDGTEGVGSTTEAQRNRVAAAIYANCEHLDNAQLDEIIAWVQLYKGKRPPTAYRKRLCWGVSQWRTWRRPAPAGSRRESMSMDQNRGWIVRSGNDYLCPAGGDVGFTAELSEAGAFASREEAEQAGQDHCDPGYVILRDPRCASRSPNF